MSTIKREIAYKLEEVTEMMLRGAAADYPAYASLVARYRVLKELDDFLREQRLEEVAETNGETSTDVEK